ncbi:MAG: calcium/sodium antiporter [Proteobacteria bacterium]|nr:calcium/sodium antiporter [Pseudomonadota bacterium]
METVLDVVWLVVGGTILYVGAEWLVKGSAGLARAFGVKPLIIGLTVVAYGTSAPELAVSTSAILRDSSDLVLGNVFGSCIANLGLILGITALLSPPMVDSRLIRRELPVLVLSAVAAPLALYGGQIGRLEAALLLSGAIAFTLYTLFVSSAEDPGEVNHGVDDSEDSPIAESSNKLGLVGITLLGLALLVGGGELFVEGAKGVALALGMSEHLIGLTFVALGTSLPELAASLVAAARGYSSLAVGNVVGSNIFNTFLVLGVVGCIRPIDGKLSELTTDMSFLVGITLLSVLFMRGARKVTRIEGILLTACYGSFIVLKVIGC